MKRLLIFLLCFVLVSSSLSFAVTAAETVLAKEAAEASVAGSGATADEIAPTGYTLLNEGEFQNKLSYLRSKYPNGSTWEGVYYEYGSPKAWTCFAYAAQMMFEIFGARYYEDRLSYYTDYSSDGICAGDIVRIDGDSHSIFITKVTANGYYFTDGNGTGVYNQVRWDGFYSVSEMRSRFYYKIHLPGNDLSGIGISHTVTYNANGGNGSMAAFTVLTNEGFRLRRSEFSRSGYTFAGYTVRRSYDNTWFTADAGWQTLDDIYDNGYRFLIYSEGSAYNLSTNWLGNITSSTGFTFYAQWVPNTSTVEFMSNASNYNYILGSDLSVNYSNYIYPRDNDVYSMAVDKFEKLNNVPSLRITAHSAGSANADFTISTSTNKGYGDGFSQACIVGDNKTFTMRFNAKSSVNGAKMYIRWGFSGKYTSVTLTSDWKTYSVSLPKNRYFGTALHPYFDTAGTYYLNSLSLSDSAYVSNVAPETGNWEAPSQTVRLNGTLNSMPIPARTGYIFLGWYTAAEGGTRVTTDTPIKESTLRLYAHWRKDVTYTPVKTMKYNGHIYELYENALGWDDASRFCSSIGGHLVTITNGSENMAVYDLIGDRQGYCWIGLRYHTDINAWKWVDETTIAQYNKWYDYSNAMSDTGEYYGMMYPMNYNTKATASAWDKCVGSSYYSSYYGYYNSFFICEYDSPLILGDADGSGEIESTDATLIQRYLADIKTNVATGTLMRGDVNGSQDLDVIDATCIQRYLASVNTPYRVGEWLKEQ